MIGLVPSGIEEAMARVVTVSYRPVEFAYFLEPADALAIPDAEGLCGDIVEDILGIVDEIRAPNAMRPSGWSLAGGEAGDALARAMRDAAEDGALWHLYGRDGSFLRALDTPTFHETYLEQSDGDEIHGCYAFSGDAVDVSGSIMTGFTGAGSADPRAFFTGLARVTSTGRYLVAADAPLSVQAASLSDALEADDFEDEDEMRSVSDHVSHVMILSQALSQSGQVDPGAWIDLSQVQRVMEMALDEERRESGLAIGRQDVVKDMLDELDEARRDDPMWRIANRVEAAPAMWTARDGAASGMDWARLDDGIRSLPWGGSPVMPGNDAQFLILPKWDSAQVARVRSLLGKAEILCSLGSSLVVRDEGRNLSLALLDAGERVALVAWSVRSSARLRVDPLMAETFAETLVEPPSPEGRVDDAYVEAMDNLADLGFGGILPSPDHMPDYPGLMLMSSHRRGRTIADLCASLAAVIREGRADEAFRHEDPDGEESPLTDDEVIDREAAARQAEAFGGRADAPLVAMLEWVDGIEWEGVDLERDLRMLKDAAEAGLTLEDLSAAIMTGPEDGEAIEMPPDPAKEAGAATAE